MLRYFADNFSIHYHYISNNDQPIAVNIPIRLHLYNDLINIFRPAFSVIRKQGLMKNMHQYASLPVNFTLNDTQQFAENGSVSRLPVLVISTSRYHTF